MSGIYDGLNAKIAAMRGNLLTPEDYAALSRHQTVEEVVNGLREHPSYGVLSSVQGADVHRRFVEQKLLLSLTDDFMRIYGYISDFRLREYFDSFFLNRAILMLKKVLRAIYDDRAASLSVGDLNITIAGSLDIDVQMLVSSKTIPEFIDNLKGTPFYELFQSVDDNVTLFELENKLDVYYYMRLWTFQTRGLDEINRKVMRQINGTQIDLMNMQWIYRLKTYYGISETRIYSHLIPAGLRLSREELRRMVESRSADELAANLLATPYSYAFDAVGGIEPAYYKIMRRVFRINRRLYPNSLSSTVAFIHMKEMEIQNLVALIEGVRYKVDSDEVLKYLIMPLEEG